MNAVLKKLLYKEYKKNLIINEPEEFKEISKDIIGEIYHKMSSDNYEFILLFYTKLEDLKAQFHELKSNLKSDSLIWVAYPKGTSKKYKMGTNIKRDVLQPYLKEDGYEGVSLVSINDDWSAMRFRPIKDNIE